MIVMEVVLVVCLLWLTSYSCEAQGGLIYIAPHGDQANCPSTSIDNRARCLTMDEMWGATSGSARGWVPVSDTTLSFLPGRHVVNFSRLIEFRDISNITLTASDPATTSSAPLTEIYCSKPIGFYFLNVSQLTISHLVFTKCGIDSVGGDLINNTFRIYANSFFLFDSLERMALTVASVTDLIMSSVTVQNSTGYGLLIINLFGNSIIENSKFVFSNYYTYSSILCNGTFDTADSFYICAGANIGIGFVDPPQCINRDNPPIYSLNITSTITADGINLTPFAVGSGIVIAMSQTAYGMHVYMDHVTSVNNVARNGANLAFLIYDVVDNSSVSITNSFSGYSNPLFRPSVLTILSGTQFVGGGLLFNYGRRLPSSFRPSCKPNREHYHADLLTITDTEFVGNNAILGGAMNIDFRQSDANVGIVSLISVKNCSFRDNIGSPGSALYINQLQPVQNVLLAQFFFENCTFQNNTYPLTEIPNSIQQFELDLLNAVQLISVQYSSFIDCSFEDNVGSALYGYASLFRFSGNINFMRNSGINGGGMSLHGSSIMLLTPNTTVTFLNNSAQFRGGGMFISSENYRTSLLCFWQLESSAVNNQTVDPQLVLPINRTTDDLDVAEKLNIQVTFSGNRASSAGNAIYGGVIDRCFFLPTADIIIARRSSQIFDQMFTFQGSENDTSLISSDPSRICICNHTKPMCEASNPNVTLFPGQMYEIYAIAIGQRNGNSPGVVFGGFLRDRSKGVEPAALQPSETTQQVGQNCTKLGYTILSTQLNTELQLLLALENSNVQRNPTIVTIRLLPCPPGFILSSEPPSCQCHPSLAKRGVTCDITTETVHRVPPKWFSMDLNDPGERNSLLVYDYCPFDYCIPGEVDTNLSQANTLCAFNRGGIICGGCQSGFSLTLGTNECEVCTNSYLALLIPFATAGLLLVILLLLFNSLTVSVGAINGLIFYANILQVNKGIFFPPGHNNPMTTFIAWLNLDLGIKTCFYDGMDEYTKTFLQFTFPIYLWILIGIIILLGHYLSPVAKLLGEKAVPVLATVFLLSVAKLLRTIIIGLSYATLEHSDGRQTIVWYYDANIEYLKGKHIYLFILSLAALLFIMLPFIFGLLFVTCLQALSTHRLFHWVNRSKPLIDAYVGPYKDKHRYWTGFLLFARGIILIIFTVVDPRVTLLLVTVSMQLLSVFTWVGGGVYKQWPLNALEFSFFANLGILSAATLFVQYTGGYQEGAIYTSTTIAFLEFIGIVTYAIILQLNSYFKRNMCSLDSVKEKLSQRLAPASLRKGALTDSKENLDEKMMNLSPSRKFFLAESTDLEVVMNRTDSNSLEGSCTVAMELREPLLESGHHTV